ncbi:MAG: pseudouridine-5'-phosphate glycosidase [Acidimicrobiaceae bacterium]|nr:pseudouridine-5'-phosphate glycosidase [Acidimicrobiaceae bacterium]
MERVRNVRLSDDVSRALAEDKPVVALESTVFSTLGLPKPANADALERCTSTIEENGAVAAVTAVIDGELRLGITESEWGDILNCKTKVASRDLPFASAEGIRVGATTVSASLAIAEAAGVKVFCTGGIGGVHHGYQETGDLSADLYALARHRVVCISAGAKVFLDLRRTMEVLESLGVPVLGWKTDNFPAFYIRNSKLPITQVNNAETVVKVFRNASALGLPQGVLVGVPIPKEHQLDPESTWSLIDDTLAEAKKFGISGPGVTPFILEALAKSTKGESVPANLALLENNARAAVEIAKQFQQE